jgi:hypothetical protein
MFDWDALLVRLRADPPHFHRVLSAASGKRIEAVERDLGKLPSILKEMLSRINGAKLFNCGIPVVTLFRISTVSPPPALEWSPEWCIDTFTPKWRAAGSNRQDDWAMAMTNYGGLVLLGADGMVKEWDTSESRWLLRDLAFDEWIEKMISEGKAVMAE